MTAIQVELAAISVILMCISIGIGRIVTALMKIVEFIHARQGFR